MAKTVKTIRSIDELPAVLKVQDIQEVMGISKVTAYELANSEGFPVLRVGKRLLIPKTAFVQWMEANTGKRV
jgi:excisionase family DNA binding protein